MKKTTFLKIAFVLLLSGLMSTAAFAQLSLGASADAEASSETGASADADAAADADAETEGDATAEGEEPAPAPIPEPEPAPVAPPAPMEEPMETDAATVGGDGVAGWDQGFYIKSGDGNFKLKINGMGKVRYDLYGDTYAVEADGGGNGTNNTMHSDFSLPYARILLTGHMFTDRLTYALYYDFAATNLIYAYADWAFIKDKVHLRAGLFKRPFSRAYLTSSVKRQMIDNPLGEFGEGIDIGAQVSNNYQKVSGLEWAVGVFNGSQNGGAATGTPTQPFLGGGPQQGIGVFDFSPMLSGRIGYNNGIKGYAPTDFEGGPFRFGVALSAQMEFDHDDNDVTNHQLGLDFIMKIQGLSLSAAAYLNAVGQNALFDQPDVAGDPYGLNGFGTYVQAGYLIAQRFEPVVRYSLIHSPKVADDAQQEITAGLGIFFFENHFKWENNFSLLLANEENWDNTGREIHMDTLFSSQMQFFF